MAVLHEVSRQATSLGEFVVISNYLHLILVEILMQKRIVIYHTFWFQFEESFPPNGGGGMGMDDQGYYNGNGMGRGGPPNRGGPSPRSRGMGPRGGMMGGPPPQRGGMLPPRFKFCLILLIS